PENIKSYLREIGLSLKRGVRIDVAGSAAVILTGQLEKDTDDIDVIDEVPKEIRDQHDLLEELKLRYGLSIGHVQRHYFALHWEDRIHFLGYFGNITVYLLDAKDVFLSKLFSRRKKDMDDLLVLKPQLAKEAIADLLKRDCQALFASVELHKMATDNWYILYGEPSPA